jgi:hypothetical protein
MATTSFLLKFKYVINRIFAPFLYIWNIRKHLKFDKINAKLEKSLNTREVDRIILKGQILKMLRKFCRVDARSLYIPKDYKSRCIIKDQIYLQFGTEMELLGISVTSNLVIKE